MFYYSIDVLIRLLALEFVMFYCLLGWPSSGSTKLTQIKSIDLHGKHENC